MAFKTLREMYLQSVERFGSRPAFSILDGDAITFSQFGERVEEVAGMLREAGLSSGDKVALLSSSMPNWGVCYFAAVSSGMVVVPILPDFSGSELDMIIRHSDAKGLMVSDKLFSKISKEVIDDLNIVIRTKNLSVISRREGIDIAGTVTPPREEDLAAIIYTSGTTSAPKGVMLTHRNLCRQVEMIYDLYPINENDIFLSILPLSHTYECSVGMLYPLAVGASVVYLEKSPSVSTLLPALKAVRPTVLLSVPLIIEKLYKSQIAAKFNKGFKKRLYSIGFIRRMIHRKAGRILNETFGGRMRFFGVGGAKLDSVTERFLYEARFPYAIGYGLTETSPLIAGAIPGKTRIGSTGPVLSQIKARLENVNAETGEGELVVLSPSTMKGYYKNPEATADVFTEDGWFRTKDSATFDKDGYLYIKGRLNSMIVGPSGENIYPEEIESVLNQHSLVSDSFVKEEKGKLIAMVHFNKEEMERKYQHFKEGMGYKMEEIKSDILHYVNSKVNKFSKISTVQEQNEGFEKTPTHKIKRFLYSKNDKNN